MIVVIDGYNVLKQLVHGRDISENERRQFIAQLGKYARCKKHKILVVFDAGPHDRAHKERVQGVSVVYSGMHETADDYIMRYLESHRSFDLLLVSSDRELNRCSSRLSIPSINADDFYRLMQEALQLNASHAVSVGGQITKTTEREDSALDELMHQASERMPTKADDVRVSRRHNASYKHSKIERKLLKKLKKI